MNRAARAIRRIERARWTHCALIALLSLLASASVYAQRVPEVDDVYASGESLRSLGPAEDSHQAIEALSQNCASSTALRYDFTLSQIRYSLAHRGEAPSTLETEAHPTISGTVAIELDDAKQRMHVTYRVELPDGGTALAAARREHGAWTHRVIQAGAGFDPSGSTSWLTSLDLSDRLKVGAMLAKTDTPEKNFAMEDLTAGDVIRGYRTVGDDRAHVYVTFDPATALPSALRTWGWLENDIVQLEVEIRQFQLNPPLPKPALFPKISP